MNINEDFRILECDCSLTGIEGSIFSEKLGASTTM